MQQTSHGCTACVPLPAAAQKLRLLTAAGHDRGLYYWTVAAMEWEPQIEALWHMLGGARLTNADKRKALTVGGAFFTDCIVPYITNKDSLSLSHQSAPGEKSQSETHRAKLTATPTRTKLPAYTLLPICNLFSRQPMSLSNSPP